MTLREFDGWTPREIHEQFDPNGRLIGTTIVTREAAWDDEQRAAALALAEYKSTLCSCGCGQPAAQSYGGKQAYRVDTFTCSAGRAIEQVRRQKQEAAERDKRPAGWDDGLHYYVVPVDTPENKKPKGA